MSEDLIKRMNSYLEINSKKHDHPVLRILFKSITEFIEDKSKS